MQMSCNFRTFKLERCLRMSDHKSSRVVSNFLREIFRKSGHVWLLQNMSPKVKVLQQKLVLMHTR